MEVGENDVLRKHSQNNNLLTVRGITVLTKNDA